MFICDENTDDISLDTGHISNRLHSCMRLSTYTSCQTSQQTAAWIKFVFIAHKCIKVIDNFNLSLTLFLNLLACLEAQHSSVYK